MAKKISQLTQATEVKSDDVTVIVQDGETKKLPLNMMVTKQDVENKKIAGLAKLDEIEATYENDTYTPTITVKNKSSVKTGEGDEVDYSANVMDGHVKSAILSGQTLVNLVTQSEFNAAYTSRVQVERGYRYTQTQHHDATRIGITSSKNGRFKTNTTYYVQLTTKVNKARLCEVRFESGQTSTITLSANETKVIKAKVGSGQTLQRFFIYFRPSDGSDYVGDTFDILDLVVLEHQEGMENWDIPYFEGMQSVKLPVLTTTGKNLFNKELIVESWVDGITGIDTGNSGCYVPIRVSGAIAISGYTPYNGNPTYVYEYDGNGKYITRTSGSSEMILNLNETTELVKVGFYKGTVEHIKSLNIQVEKGAQATTYEPYKSNILHTPEEVVLRSLPNGVKDTLNLNTGEYVQRIDEIVLDGSENWVVDSNVFNNTYRFALTISNMIRKDWHDIITQEQFVKSNVFKSLDLRVEAHNLDTEHLTGWDASRMILNINKAKLSENSVNALKTYLQQNPITVQYELATPIIKTVDLIPSGTHPSTTPYCWKDGHIQLSSSGLLPSLEYSVVTSRAGQISQNAAMIVKNDKRIFDLEILLAGGLVNTTYQALTLQNQVETGLSKVSLSSETEPDYLLYHMIMKLIEEKAYKLDDLTEKVSVFYLYEKLSDEQFETIYSALYPFVEDEIVEEPIVDEVLEEVENGVVM